MPFEDAERELAEIEPRLRVPTLAQIGQRPQHACCTDEDVLQRARRAPAIPVVGAPEELRPAERAIRVGDDLADASADPRLVPRLVGERLEVLRPVEQRRQATSRTRCASASARSFFSPWCSIWRMRSRVTLECAADLVERTRLLAVEPVAQLEHHPLALRERTEDRPERLALQRRLRELVRERRRLVGEEVTELRLVVVADRLLERDGNLRATPDLLDLVRRHLDVARDLVHERLATELGAELPLRAHDPVELLDDVDGHADRAALVRDRTRDGLADPPGRVGRELEALAVVELLRRTDEPDRPLLDQVEERQTLVAVALRDRHDEPEVRLHHRLLGGVLAALDALRELDLLCGGQQRDLADVLEEELKGVGRDLGLGLDLRLGLIRSRSHHGDLRLVESSVEVVELPRVELQLVERERELVGVDLARAIPDLEEALALVAGEGLLDRRSGGSALRFFSGQTAPLPRRPSHGSYRYGGRQSDSQERASRIVSR